MKKILIGIFLLTTVAAWADDECDVFEGMNEAQISAMRDFSISRLDNFKSTAE